MAQPAYILTPHGILHVHVSTNRRAEFRDEAGRLVYELWSYSRQWEDGSIGSIFDDTTDTLLDYTEVWPDGTDTLDPAAGPRWAWLLDAATATGWRMPEHDRAGPGGGGERSC